MLSIKEKKVLNETNEKNIIRSKIKALEFRLLTCLDDERQSIEEEIVHLKYDLKKLQKLK